MRLTPPPASLVREDVLQGVRMRAEMVADALGLNSVAQLDALMHAESADLVVVDAHAIPYLDMSSDLYQQVRTYFAVDLYIFQCTAAGLGLTL